MVDKCKHCGKNIIKFPLRDENNNFLWKNLFKMDWMSIMYLITIVALLLAYKVDIEKCDTVINDPCGYCDTSGCCLVSYKPLMEESQIFNSNFTIEQPN